MQITLVELALSVIAICLLILTGIAIRISIRIVEASRRVDDTHRYVTYLRPRVERFLDESAAELEEFKVFTRTANRVAGQVDEVTGEVKQLLVPALSRIRNLDNASRYLNAAMAGARVGVAALRRDAETPNPESRKGNGHRSQEAKER